MGIENIGKFSRNQINLYAYFHSIGSISEELRYPVHMLIEKFIAQLQYDKIKYTQYEHILWEFDYAYLRTNRIYMH